MARGERAMAAELYGSLAAVVVLASFLTTVLASNVMCFGMLKLFLMPGF